MTWLKRTIAALLNVTVLSVLLLGSCAAPGTAYFQSPWWFLKAVGPEPGGTFFIAMRPEAGAGSQPVEVKKFDARKMSDANPRYNLPAGQLSYRWGAGQGSATIHVTAEAPGSQLVRVFVVGDTPWTSLSEYRVADSTVRPLRHAHSASWLLLGIPLGLVLTILLWKPIQRRIRRMVGVEPD